MTLFRLLADFDGRIGLGRFWLGSAVVALALFGIQQAAPAVFGHDAGRAVAFAQAFALFPWAALAAKRATDRGSSGLYGILLICAIVLPGQLRPVLPLAWAPSLDTISLIAWLFALVDLGLMPSVRDEEPLAAGHADAKAGAWTPSRPSPSIPSTPSH
ncbi:MULTISPECIES: DUF805 domain-containing protein [unclassified Bosea (in: a-proteobacteria)]|jgi:uncharacterized membrane protein YhaH (DUF805 family)|uniref:DUF805 domain-containing protein n=1 Tax=unclassified Bosea (in: a-proteobacteria) TaxID=2653178 RepID=UPI00083DED99|nr:MULTISPECIES: DUF805 domain-containing protein [unclassified Bosea (in: a-proteobacteria)]AOG06738.1 hypothetical protein BSY19_1241 [Bosea sp. RAC05]MBA4269012.1 DUF805 domain-containing protein [Methylobacterium sp.]WRH57643.1 MAG: DUF805 domain-containing protein [Bosea sp. (in: a-proteobacteria)]